MNDRVLSLRKEPPSRPGLRWRADPCGVGQQITYYIPTRCSCACNTSESVASSLREPVVFDGRNLYEPEMLERYGLIYYAIGRGRSQFHSQ